MSVQDAISKRNDIIFNNVGKDGNSELHNLYPDEFEYYAIALELLDSNNEREMFLTFPLMPESISEDERSINNIRKTQAGVVITNNSSFVPFDIVLNGTFGKKFRMITGLEDKIENNNQSDYFGTAIYVPGRSLQSVSVTNRKSQVFSENVKTGFGVTRILRKMYKASFKLDANGGLRKLLYYNLAMNSAYVVEPLAFNMSQNRANNMIWNYVLNMKAVAPINRLAAFYKGRLQEITQQNAINKYVNQSVRDVDRILDDQEKQQSVVVLDKTKINNILSTSKLVK